MDLLHGSIQRAKARQTRQDGKGPRCAACGEIVNTTSLRGEGWYAVPRIPLKQGGQRAENCVILCPKCNDRLAQDGTKEIPYEDIPFYKAAL